MKVALLTLMIGGMVASGILGPVLLVSVSDRAPWLRRLSRGKEWLYDVLSLWASVFGVLSCILALCLCLALLFGLFAFIVVSVTS